MGLYFVLEPIGAQRPSFVNIVTNVFDQAAVHMPRRKTYLATVTPLNDVLGNARRVQAQQSSQSKNLLLCGKN